MLEDKPKDFWENPPASNEAGEFIRVDESTFILDIPDVWGRGLPNLRVLVVASALGVIVTAAGSWSTIMHKNFTALSWGSEDTDMLYRMSQVIAADLELQMQAVDVVMQADEIIFADSPEGEHSET